MSTSLSDVGYQLVSSGVDGIKFWKVRSGGQHPRLQRTTKPQQRPVRWLKWNHTSTKLAIGSVDGSVLLLTAAQGDTEVIQVVSDGQEEGETFNAVDFGCSSRYIGTGGTSKIVYVYDTKHQQIIKRFQGHTSAITTLCFNTPGEIILTGNINGELLVHSIVHNKDGPMNKLVPSSPTEVKAVQCSPHSKKHNWVAASYADGRVCLWDILKQNPLMFWFHEHSSCATGVCFSPVNPQLMVSCGLDRKICFYDVEQKKVVKVSDTAAPLTAVSFLEDGKTIAVGTSVGGIQFYDLSRDQHQLMSNQLDTAHPGEILCLQFQTAPLRRKHSSASSTTSRTSATSSQSQQPGAAAPGVESREWDKESELSHRSTTSTTPSHTSEPVITSTVRYKLPTNSSSGIGSGISAASVLSARQSNEREQHNVASASISSLTNASNLPSNISTASSAGTVGSIGSIGNTNTTTTQSNSAGLSSALSHISAAKRARTIPLDSATITVTSSDTEQSDGKSQYNVIPTIKTDYSALRTDRTSDSITTPNVSTAAKSADATNTQTYRLLPGGQRVLTTTTTTTGRLSPLQPTQGASSPHLQREVILLQSGTSGGSKQPTNQQEPPKVQALQPTPLPTRSSINLYSPNTRSKDDSTLSDPMQTDDALEGSSNPSPLQSDTKSDSSTRTPSPVPNTSMPTQQPQQQTQPATSATSVWLAATQPQPQPQQQPQEREHNPSPPLTGDLKSSGRMNVIQTQVYKSPRLPESSAKQSQYSSQHEREMGKSSSGTTHAISTVLSNADSSYKLHSATELKAAMDTDDDMGATSVSNSGSKVYGSSTSPVVEQFKGILEDSTHQLYMATHSDVRNLHIEMVKQFVELQQILVQHSKHVDSQFSDIKDRLDKLEDNVGALNQKLHGI